MKMARESPLNPAVEKIERPFTARDLAYCDMQGNIFMAAIDQGYAMERFVPVYMNSQLAGIIDYSFSVSGLGVPPYSYAAAIPAVARRRGDVAGQDRKRR